MGVHNELQSWNPYHSWDMLIFKTAGNKIPDSIFITNIEEQEQQEVSSITVNCEILHAGSSEKKNEKKHSWLLKLTALPNGNAVLDVNLQTPGAAATFTSKPLSWLDSLPKSSIDMDADVFYDVVEIIADSIPVNPSDHPLKSLPIKKLFWSKSQGILKYELQDGTVWLLEKKYNL
jgi:hypothetical protein